MSAITKSRGYSAKFSFDAENEGKKKSGKEERSESKNESASAAFFLHGGTVPHEITF